MTSNKLLSSLTVFGDDLYAGTFRIPGPTAESSQVWRTADGTNWQHSGNFWPGGAHLIAFWDNAMTVFKGSLYIAADNWDTGGQIWQMLHRQVFLPLVVRNY